MVDFREYQLQTGRIIPLINAPGTTAGGVGDYVLAAVIELQDAGVLSSKCTVGIWGYGNCGQATAQRLKAIGCEVIAYDPPLEHESGGRFRSASLDELLSADCITLHLPLTNPGESYWPTRGIVDRKVLNALRGKVLINTSRGGVLDETAAVDMARRELLTLVLDVYKGEPMVNPVTVETAFLATPHIAGSIRQGKLRALRHVYTSLCRVLETKPKYDFDTAMDQLKSPFEIQKVPLDKDGRNFVKTSVGLRALSRRFQSEYQAGEFSPLMAATFTRLRKVSMRDELLWPW